MKELYDTLNNHTTLNFIVFKWQKFVINKVIIIIVKMEIIIKENKIYVGVM